MESKTGTKAMVMVALLLLSMIMLAFNMQTAKADAQLITQSAKIGAYYYAWWGMDINDHWFDNIKGTPSLGYYHSSDPVIADEQILLAKQHGVNFFAVSWIGKGDWYPGWDFPVIDSNLRNGLLKANHLPDFSFCLFYETDLVITNARARHKNFTQIYIEDMNYSLQYLSNPSYLRVNGDPVLFIYDVPYLYAYMATQDVHQLFDCVRQQLAAKGTELYIIGDVGGGPPSSLNPDWLYSMNATTSYFFSDPNEGWRGVLEDATTYYPQWQSAMNAQGMAYVPDAYPGFNNTLNEGAVQPWVVLPRNASAFGDMLETALNTKDEGLGIVMITSWNEWMEGTMVEPSMEENETFLNVVYSAVTSQRLTVYINADGSIAPAGAPIVTSDNITYSLAGDISYPTYYGIVLQRNNTTIDGNGYAVQGNESGTGLYLTNINNVTIKNTNIKSFGNGIWLYSSSNNSISGNNITANNFAGIWLSSSNNNSVSGNNMAANKWYGGIGLDSSNNNTIYHNNFINNTSQVLSSNSTNVWDNGYPSGGNYWSDYNGTNFNNGVYQNETGSDGIGDTPYVIDVNDMDQYPLMGPWTVEGESVTVALSNNVTVTFSNVTSGGITTVVVNQNGPTPPSGFELIGSMPVYYDVGTSANYTGIIMLSIGYNDTGLTIVQERALRLMHWNENAQQWTDITTSVDVDNKVVCGEADHLSAFAIVLALSDLAVKDVLFQKTVVFRGYCLNANVTVENQGYLPQSFTIFCYANATCISSRSYSDVGGESSNIVFIWNTTGFAYGNYTISACAETVPGETNTSNNNCTGGWVVVSLVGDIAGPSGWPDGKVDIRDVSLVARHFGETVPPAPANCDSTGPTTGVPDGKIDIRDVSLVARHFGDHYP